MDSRRAGEQARVPLHDASQEPTQLDARCAFTGITGEGVDIYWGAYLGTPSEILIAGPVAEVADQIVAARAEARRRHGWIMDVYLLRSR